MDDNLKAYLDAMRRDIYDGQQRIETKIDRLAADVHSLKVRMSTNETESGYVRVGLGEINGRLDRIDVRLTLIETRLELRDAS